MRGIELCNRLAPLCTVSTGRGLPRTDIRPDFVDSVLASIYIHDFEALWVEITVPSALGSRPMSKLWCRTPKGENPALIA